MTRLKKIKDYISTKKIITYSFLCVITFFILCATLIPPAKSAFLILAVLFYLGICVLCKFEIPLIILVFLFSFKGIGGNVFLDYNWYDIFTIVFLCVGAVKYLIDCINHKNKIYVVPLTLSLVLVAYCFLFFNSSNTSMALYYIAILGMFYLLFVNVKSYDKIRVVKFILYGVLFSALIGGICAINPKTREISVYIDELRFQALLSHPNHLHVVCCLALATSIFLYFKKKLNILLFYFLFCSFFLIGFMTKSKAFLIISAMLLLGYIFLEMLKNRKRGFIILLITIIFGGIGFLVFKERFLTIFDRFTEYKYEHFLDNILTGRWTIWKNYIDAWSSSKKSILLGYGATADNLFDAGTHNAYIGLLYRIGIVGIILAIALIISYLVYVKNKFKRINQGINLIPLLVMMIIFLEEELSVLLVYSCLVIFDVVEKKAKVELFEVVDKALTKDIKISVILPIYKVEDYLCRGVDSVLNQSHKNLEVILVDDGSPDNCPKICDEYAQKDNRVVVIHKQNGGVSSARNEGLKVATGDYVGFVDPDDIIDNCFYEKLLSSIIKEKSDLAVCGMKYVYENEKIKNVHETNLVKLNQEKIYKYLLKVGYNSTNEGLKTENIMGSVWRVLFSKEIIQDITFPAITVCEDMAYLIDVFAKNPKVSVVPEFLYGYFQRGSSAIHQYNETKILNRINAYKLICSKIEDKVDKEDIDAYKFHIYSSLINEVIKNNGKDKLNQLLENEFVKSLNSKNNYKLAFKNNKSLSYKLAYFLIYHKCFWLYSILLKII